MSASCVKHVDKMEDDLKIVLYFSPQTPTTHAGVPPSVRSRVQLQLKSNRFRRPSASSCCCRTSSVVVVVVLVVAAVVVVGGEGRWWREGQRSPQLWHGGNGQPLVGVHSSVLQGSDHVYYREVFTCTTGKCSRVLRGKYYIPVSV